MKIGMAGTSTAGGLGRAAKQVFAGGLRLLLGVFATALLMGCSGDLEAPAVQAGDAVTGSGNLITRELDLGGFTGVESGSAFKVDVYQSNSHVVSITADDNVIDRIQAQVIDDTLTLSLDSGSYYNATYRARIGLPDLRNLSVSEASTATVAGFKSQEAVDFRLDGASSLTGRLESDRVRVVSDGASVVTLGGTTGSLSIEASGASQANLGDWTAGSASAHLKGASKATLNVEGRLDADLRGASTLYYVGNPTLGTITSIEASSLKRR